MSEWNPWLLEAFAWTSNSFGRSMQSATLHGPSWQFSTSTPWRLRDLEWTWDPLPFIIKQLSCLLRNGRSVPSSYGLVSCEQLRDSRSPHNRGGQLEVLAEAGFVLSARPSGKEQDFQGWWWGEEKCFPSARQRRDLCYAICERTCTFSLRLFWHFSLPISCPRHLQGPAERFSHPWWRCNALAHQL